MKQNNCQGCGCINEDQCICMKEEYKNNNIKKEVYKDNYILKEHYEDKYITYHPAGVNITFNSWEEYNKYMVYNYDIRKEYCEQAYETGIKDGIKKAKDSNGLQNLLIYEAGVEDGIAKVKEKVSKGQDKSNKDKSQSKLELVEPAEVKVKVNNMQEFLDIWDVLYPKE